MEYFSPAKINLFLKVIGKREDGFHSLFTFMQVIDIGDTLTFEKSSKDELYCSSSFLSNGPDNLVWRALQLFKKNYGSKICYHITLDKQLPIQAGIGGGSSNAATTLFALNQSHGRPFSMLQLRSMALKLGSDVPFFFSSGSALCKGRGEELSPIDKPKLPGDACLVLPGELKLSTPKVFQAYVKNKKFSSEVKWGENDLLQPALALEPRLVKLCEELKTCFEFYSLSGSGPSFFAWGQKKPFTAAKTLSIQALARQENHWYSQPIGVL